MFWVRHKHCVCSCFQFNLLKRLWNHSSCHTNTREYNCMSLNEYYVTEILLGHECIPHSTLELVLGDVRLIFQCLYLLFFSVRRKQKQCIHLFFLISSFDIIQYVYKSDLCHFAYDTRCEYSFVFKSHAEQMRVDVFIVLENYDSNFIEFMLR